MSNMQPAARFGMTTGAQQLGGAAANSTARSPKDAAQFMPFAALTGFEAEIREQERKREARRMVSEERAGHIMRMFCRLSKGDVVRVVYYNRDAYSTTTGTIRQIDPAFHVLELTNCQAQDESSPSGYSYKPSSLRIPFEDLWDIDWA